MASDNVLPSVQPFHAMAYPLSLAEMQQISRKYAQRVKMNVALLEMPSFRFHRKPKGARIRYHGAVPVPVPVPYLWGSYLLSVSVEMKRLRIFQTRPTRVYFLAVHGMIPPPIFRYRSVFLSVFAVGSAEHAVEALKSLTTTHSCSGPMISGLALAHVSVAFAQVVLW